MSLLKEHQRRDMPKVDLDPNHWPERLRAELLEAGPFVRIQNGDTVTPLIMAIRRTWWEQDRPNLALVFGESYSAGYQHAERCDLAHPLVVAGLADPGDLFADRYSYEHTGVAVLHDPELAHSQIRWIEASGDRVIVVLPPEYDAL